MRQYLHNFTYVRSKTIAALFGPVERRRDYLCDPSREARAGLCSIGAWACIASESRKLPLPIQPLLSRRLTKFGTRRFLRTPCRQLLWLTSAVVTAKSEDEAWQRLHEQYGPTVFRILLGLTKGDPHVATEALQKTYPRVSRHVRVCDGEVMWVSWLRVLARSALCDVLRGKYRFWNLIKHHQYSVPEDRAMTAPETDVLARLDTALAQVGPEIRLLLQRKYFRGESVRSIADIDNTVRQLSE